MPKGRSQVAAMSFEITQPAFWLTIVEIIWINILLSGDNAVVIALACRGLPPRERKWGMVVGAGVAVALRLMFAGVVSALMTLPYVKAAGALALLWIGAKLMVPPEHDEEGTPEAARDLWRAVRIIAVADIVMSLDNVIAVAAAAKGNFALLVFGLALSIPIVVAGSAIILAVLERFPLLVWGGAAILGWVAGEIFATDPVVTNALSRFEPFTVELVSQIVGVLLVLLAGWIWQRAVAPTQPS
jgi:YjbE family integral membrane protein